jgi:glycosyltransferase involved in cell wall biosynthesis
MKISVVIPTFNEEESLPELCTMVVETVRKMHVPFEILFIDDGSSDNSLKVIEDLHQKYEQVKAVSFRRNYGKSEALNEGFRIAEGDIVITMDADLQDDPREIPRLVEKLNGFDLVSGWKKKRHDPLKKIIPSKLFNFTTALLTGIRIHDFNCGLKAYRRDVIKDIPVYGELHRYLPVLAYWRGYSVGELIVQHHPRKFGITKYGWRRFFSGFFDLLTVLFLTRFRQRPLHLFGFFGLILFFFGFIISIYLSILWLQGYPIGNRPLLFLGVLLIIVGMQSFSIGLIGEMLANIRDESHAPSIKKTIGLQLRRKI